MLVWISVQLLVEEDDGHAEHQSHSNLAGAIKTILVADVVMSLDNTLAIAGVARGDWFLLITGLTLSIPLIVIGSTLIMKIMDRFPIVVYIGAALIAWTSGEMIVMDLAVQPLLPHFFYELPYLQVAIVAGVLGFGWWSNYRQGRTSRNVLDADLHAAERIEDKLG
jgi:predicted tellurium resistance membrane protein TerC